MEKHSNLKPGGNKGLQYLVAIDLSNGTVYIYRSVSDMARSCAVNSASIRNLFVGGVDAVDFRGYRLCRVRAYGGVDWWKYIGNRKVAVVSAKPSQKEIEIKGIENPKAGRNGAVRTRTDVGRFSAALRLRLGDSDPGDEVL